MKIFGYINAYTRKDWFYGVLFIIITILFFYYILTFNFNWIICLAYILIAMIFNIYSIKSQIERRKLSDLLVDNFAKTIGMIKARKLETTILEFTEKPEIDACYYKDTKIGRFELYQYRGKRQVLSGRIEICLTVFEITLKTDINSEIRLETQKNINISEFPEGFQEVKFESNTFVKGYKIFAGDPKDAYHFFNPAVIDAINGCNEDIGMYISKNKVALYSNYYINNSVSINSMYHAIRKIILAHTNEDLKL